MQPAPLSEEVSCGRGSEQKIDAGPQIRSSEGKSYLPRKVRFLSLMESSTCSELALHRTHRIYLVEVTLSHTPLLHLPSPSPISSAAPLLSFPLGEISIGSFVIIFAMVVHLYPVAPREITA